MQTGLALPKSLEEELVDILQRVEKEMPPDRYRNILLNLASIDPSHGVLEQLRAPSLSAQAARRLVPAERAIPSPGPTVQAFVRPELAQLLRRYWHESLYGRPPHDNVLSWTPPAEDQWRWYQLVLQQLQEESELYPWRRAIAELHILDNYEALRVDARAKRVGGVKRRSGERDSAHAVRQFLAARTPGHHDGGLPDEQEVGKAQHQALRVSLVRNLRRARRWRILIDGCDAGSGGTGAAPAIQGLGLGAVLACGPAVYRKM